MVVGQFPSRKLPSKPKTNPNPNLNPNRGAIFHGSNCNCLDDQKNLLWKTHCSCRKILHSNDINCHTLKYIHVSSHVIIILLYYIIINRRRFVYFQLLPVSSGVGSFSFLLSCLQILLSCLILGYLRLAFNFGSKFG